MFTAPDAHVLIVDDNPINLSVASGIIEPLEMHVDTAGSAAETIEKVRKTKYDLIFMDHMMPEVDGVETTHIIRRMIDGYENVPIVALTANAMGGTREMFLREGMNDFLAKPIEVSEMVAMVRKWMPAGVRRRRSCYLQKGLEKRRQLCYNRIDADRGSIKWKRYADT